MYEEIRKRLYGLFTTRGIRIETNTTADYDNFCCLKITEEPEEGTTLIVGKFCDDTIETLLLAHEFGHILHYKALSQEEAEAAYRALLASNHLGLENISTDDKRTVIAVEEKASRYALTLLEGLTADNALLDRARDTYRNWITGYCKKAKLPETDTLPCESLPTL